MWWGQNRSHRRAAGYGLLPLSLMPLLVGRSGQCLLPLEAGGREGHGWQGAYATFAKTPMSERQYCKKCGGHLMANHPPLKMVDVFAATIPSPKFVPGVHVNYGETVLPMKDGLTKFSDFPSEFGGSGKTVSELLRDPGRDTRPVAEEGAKQVLAEV